MHFLNSAGSTKSVIINAFMISEHFRWIQLHHEWFEKKCFVTDDNEWHFVHSSWEMSRWWKALSVLFSMADAIFDLTYIPASHARPLELISAKWICSWRLAMLVTQWCRSVCSCGSRLTVGCRTYSNVLAVHHPNAIWEFPFLIELIGLP